MTRLPRAVAAALLRLLLRSRLPAGLTVHGAQALGLAPEHGLGVAPQRRLDKQLAPAGRGVEVGRAPAGAARKLGAGDAPHLGHVLLNPRRGAVGAPAAGPAGAGAHPSSCSAARARRCGEPSSVCCTLLQGVRLCHAGGYQIEQAALVQGAAAAAAIALAHAHLAAAIAALKARRRLRACLWAAGAAKGRTRAWPLAIGARGIAEAARCVPIGWTGPID